MADISVVGLRVVCEVARHGSFSAAASALGYTQSAVSRQVALAELAVDRSLFERHPRGVDLTPAGEIVLRHATAALAELQAARVALDDLHERRLRRVSLGAFSTAMAVLVPQALATLGLHEPQVTVLLREGTSERLADRVASGRLDLAIVTATSGSPDGVAFEALLNDPLLVAMARGHRLAGLAKIDPEELRDERWIAGSSDLSSTLLGAWTTGTWKPQIAFEVRDWTAKIGLVAGGAGITVVPGLSAQSLPSGVVVAKIDHPAAMRTVVVAKRAGVDEPHITAVIQALRDSASQVIGYPRRRVSGSVAPKNGQPERF
jgi:DNA-binding transcriptional LysR family regulator